MARLGFRLWKPTFSLRRLWQSLPMIKAGGARSMVVNPYGFDESIGDSLGEVSVLSAASGESVLIKDLWDQKEELALVVLLRHFGCICCWELAALLRDSIPKFESCGIKLIAIGIGPLNKARILSDNLPFPVDCLYADPDRKAYNVLGLCYGIGCTFINPTTTKVFSRFGSIKKAANNYTLKATPNVSSVLQQGGMFVFKRKELIYARKDEGSGDLGPLNDVLNIFCNINN